MTAPRLRFLTAVQFQYRRWERRLFRSLLPRQIAFAALAWLLARARQTRCLWTARRTVLDLQRAVCFPLPVGVNTTLIAQPDPVAELAVRVVVATLKAPGAPIEIPVSATLCLLSKVKVFAALFFQPS